MPLLIKNITIIDGTGKAGYKGDILVRGEKILAVGNLSRFKAREVIDGMGAYCAPGFIDISTAADRYLNFFSNPEQPWLTSQGITTVIGGQCGISLAPVFHDSLKPIRERIGRKNFNVNWQTVGDFSRAISLRRFGVNFGTLVGHRTLRQAITHEDFRNLTANEMGVLALAAKRSLNEGAFGISFGIGHSALHPLDDAELKSLFGLAAQAKAIAAIHLPESGKWLMPTLNKIVEQAAGAGVSLLVNHFEPSFLAGNEYINALSEIERTATGSVYFSLRLGNLKIIPAASLLPLWMREDPAHTAISESEAILTQIQSKEARGKALKELSRMRGGDITVIHAPHHSYLEGKTLKEFSSLRRLTMGEGLLSLIEATRGNALISIPKGNSDAAYEMIKNARSFITANSTGYEADDSGPFVKLLRLVKEKKIISLESAVHKITGAPAALLRLRDRGQIRRGFYADLVLFRDSEVAEVIVNGTRALRESKPTGELGGKILKHF